MVAQHAFADLHCLPCTPPVLYCSPCTVCRMASVVLPALHRLSTLLVARYQFFRWALSAILLRRIWSFYGTWNFAAILRHAKFGKVQIARTYGLLNLAAEFYLEFYRYEILRLSSKFSACRGSTLKFYGQCCEQGKF
ncbi:hypothetical protein [uncultured Campylobacter sp.]|uniref:hypothetical protein n=1 Tax=uncultured Campylobacter sp. TaxID=218934 RepID=UPI0026201FA3|nr:hypothetical protein [uncultured Campylobacter sp.]